MKRKLNKDLLFTAAFLLVLVVGMAAVYYLLVGFLSLVMITCGGVLWN